PGALTGPPHTFGGGSNASILEIGSNLRMLWAPGDRPSGINATNFSYVSKNPSGDVYLTLYDSVLRFTSGRTELLTNFPFDDLINVTVRGPSGWYDGQNLFAANSNGAFVFNARTDADIRLELYSRGGFTPILIQNQTSSPAGGKFSIVSGAPGRQNALLID